MPSKGRKSAQPTAFCVLVCVFILKAAAGAVAESNIQAQSSPSSPQDDRKMLKGKVSKGEMYGANATFFPLPRITATCVSIIPTGQIARILLYDSGRH